jgi:hypothetical protein
MPLHDPSRRWLDQPAKSAPSKRQAEIRAPPPHVFGIFAGKSAFDERHDGTGVAGRLATQGFLRSVFAETAGGSLNPTSRAVA